MNIESFARKVISLTEYRKNLHHYLVKKMNAIAPNLTALIGEQVGARLISHAGSLTNLAKYPASTVQILGAEKALFRALKTRSNTPKYGLIFNSTFIGRANAKNKGRISRYLANKCSIASRIDCFSEAPSKVFGEALREQVEDRLKFFETGEIPKKNIDVMNAAAEEASRSTAMDDDDSSSPLKEDVTMSEDADSSSSKKDKKKRKKDKKEKDKKDKSESDESSSPRKEKDDVESSPKKKKSKVDSEKKDKKKKDKKKDKKDVE
jgi:nucleolar protein 56